MFMMESIDESFDAAIFIGYHARAGTTNGVLDHTSSGNVTDVSINGISMPETGYNALMAGYHDVPVVFVAGDKAVCDQATELLGNVETVAVKEGIGAAALNLHPEVAREQIRAGVEKALRKYFGKRGEQIVQDNLTCVRRGYHEMQEIPSSVITG
jgi:D-amino peptidase